MKKFIVYVNVIQEYVLEVESETHDQAREDIQAAGLDYVLKRGKAIDKLKDRTIEVRRVKMALPPDEIALFRQDDQ